MKYETRYLTTSSLEVRSLPDGTREFSGYAIRFNEWSENLGGFREKVDPAAVTRTLDAGADVRHLINHDPNLILGRTASGTTRLEVDTEGVRAITSMPDTTYARDLAVSVERGDVSQMSFGFSIAPGGDSWDWDSSPAERTLLDIDMRDVSTVTFPAYPTTTAEVRGLVRSHGQRALGDVAWSSEAGFSDYQSDISASLPADPNELYPYGWVSDVAMDGASALIAWYADSDSDCQYYVAPVTTDDAGEPSAADFGDWVAVDQEYVVAPEAARALYLLNEVRVGKSISAENLTHIQNVIDAGSQLANHLDALAAAAGITPNEAVNAESEVDEGIEGNAAPEYDHRELDTDIVDQFARENWS